MSLTAVFFISMATGYFLMKAGVKFWRAGDATYGWPPMLLVGLIYLVLGCFGLVVLSGAS